MTFLQKLLLLLQSRKFWALVAAIVTAAAAKATGQIDAWQFVQAIIASLAAYSAGIAIVDAGVAAGRRLPLSSPPRLRGGRGGNIQHLTSPPEPQP